MSLTIENTAFLYEPSVKEPFVTDAETFTESLDILGGEVIKIGVPMESQDRRERHFFLRHNPGIYTRFNIPPIITEQTLPPNSKIAMMEKVAGIAPFVKTIPVDVQQFFEDQIGPEILPPGYKAKMQGVIMQEEYSLLAIPDVMGLGKQSLMYPRVQIDVYDGKDAFSESLVLNFVSPRMESRLIEINSQVSIMSEAQEKDFVFRATQMYDSLNSDGLADLPMMNECSIGAMAKRRGFSMIDCYEAILTYRDWKSWVENLDPNSKKLPLTLSQRQILTLKKQLVEAGSRTESVLPNQQTTITTAIDIAQSQDAEEDVISGLEQLLDDVNNGYNHYYHNAVRFGPWEKLSMKAVSSNLQKVETILSSGKLNPREGTFTKGLYLAGIRFGRDIVGSLTPLMVEGHGKQGVPIVVIFEIAKREMPWFKHQDCSVSYVPVDLKTSQRRLIVKNEHVSEAREMVNDYGYDEVLVVSYEQFLTELDYLERAREFLLEKKRESLPSRQKSRREKYHSRFRTNDI